MSPAFNNLKRALTIVAIILSGSLTSLSAMAYDSQDKQILEQKVSEISMMAQDLNFEPLIDIMPPKILNYLSSKMGVPVDELKELMLQMTNGLIDENSQIEYVADLNKAKVLTSTTGRDYLIIPTKMDMVIDGTKASLSGNLLALEDEGKWYLMRVESQQQIDIVQSVYPDMVDLELFDTPIVIDD